MQGWGGTLGGSSRLSVSLSLLSPPLRRRLLLLGRAQTFLLLLHPKATAERRPRGQDSRSLPGSSCQVPARPGPSSGSGPAGGAAARRALGAGAAAAVPGGGAGLSEGGREGEKEGGEKEGERGQGAVLSPARRSLSEPRLRPGTGGLFGGGQRAGALGRGSASAPGKAAVPGRERSGVFPRSGGGGGLQWSHPHPAWSDLISRIVLCYRLCSSHCRTAVQGAGFRGELDTVLENYVLFPVLPGGRGSICLLGAEGTAVLKSLYRAATTKPDQILPLALSTCLNLYIWQRC